MSLPKTARGNADVVVGWRAFRRLWIVATVWGLVFGGTAASSALNYVSIFPTLASRQQLAATMGNDAGFSVLLGPISDIGTVGGYTVYKGFVFLTAIGAIWGLLAATRLLRGEEDTGRWQLVLAGPTRAPRATAATLVSLGAAVAIVFCGTLAVLLPVGRSPDLRLSVGETMLYALSLTIAPAVFAALGGLTSQLGRSRRTATGLGMGLFGVAFALRMVADSGPQARWLLWLTPFGWTELIRPFTENDLTPLIPAAGTVLGLCVAATVLAGRRDAGEGVLASRDTSPPRPFGLRSPFGLTVRLEIPALVAWCAGAAASAFALGVLAKAVTGPLPDSFGDAVDRFGVQGTLVDQYLSIAFLFVATVVALLPAGQLAAMAEEETTGRLVQVLTRPTSRASLFAGRLALTGAAMVFAGLVAGVAAWLGAGIRGIDVGLGATVGAGLNVVPTALVVLGVGALTLAVAPRAAVTTVYAVVIGSLVIEVLGSLAPGLGWVERLSLFHYMASAPSQGADPATVTVTLAVAVVLCAAATFHFTRRDLTVG